MKISINTEIVTLNYQIPLPVRGKKISGNQFCKVTIPLINSLYLSSFESMHQSIATETKRTLDTFFDQEMIFYDEADFTKRFFNLIKDHQSAKYSLEQVFHIECVLFFLLKLSRPDLFFPIQYIKENAVFSQHENCENYKNFECMKVKFSPRTSVESLIQILRNLHQQNPKQLFRLDGNRQFELKDFLVMMKKLQELGPELVHLIDYVEEPFKSFHDHMLAIKLAPVTIAIDESFISFYENNQLQKLPTECPIIIKPSLIGITNCYRLLKCNPQFRFIISSSFEHPSLREIYLFLATLRPLETHGISSASISVG